MARNLLPIRKIDRTPWRPGLWVSEVGNALPVKANPENGVCIYTIEQTLLAITYAMGRADGKPYIKGQP